MKRIAIVLFAVLCMWTQNGSAANTNKLSPMIARLIEHCMNTYVEYWSFNIIVTSVDYCTLSDDTFRHIVNGPLRPKIRWSSVWSSIFLHGISGFYEKVDESNDNGIQLKVNQFLALLTSLFIDRHKDHSSRRSGYYGDLMDTTGSAMALLVSSCVETFSTSKDYMVGKANRVWDKTGYQDHCSIKINFSDDHMIRLLGKGLYSRLQLVRKECFRSNEIGLGDQVSAFSVLRAAWRAVKHNCAG